MVSIEESGKPRRTTSGSKAMGWFDMMCMGFNKSGITCLKGLNGKEKKMAKIREISFTFISICALVVFSITPVWSAPDSTPAAEKTHKWLRELSLLTGYGTASLDKKSADYEIIPILPQFGFDINPLAERLHLKPRGTIECIAEPIMNVVISPDTNAEAGISLLLRYSDNITSRIAPFIEGGTGMIYTTQHTHEQGTQFNFLLQAGAGIQYFFNKNFALTGGYRYRHTSNAGISDDNEGINHHFFLVGLSYFFK